MWWKLKSATEGSSCGLAPNNCWQIPTVGGEWGELENIWKYLGQRQRWRVPHVHGPAMCTPFHRRIVAAFGFGLCCLHRRRDLIIERFGEQLERFQTQMGRRAPSLGWHSWSGRCHLKGLFAISCNYSAGSNILICAQAVLLWLLWLFQPTTTGGLLSNSHAGKGTAASTSDDSIAREEEKKRFWVQLGALTFYIWGCKFLCEVDKVSTFIFLPASAGVYST